MKIRIGYGLGTRSQTNDRERLSSLVDALEAHRFDSLWLSERITGDCPDPLVAMSFAAARTERLKFGMSVMVLPGRNPMLLAKELATLDRLSGGRMLPAFGLGIVDPREQQAFRVDRRARASMFDEALPLLRRFWSEASVDHEGEHYHYEAASVRPFPVQDPVEVWLGGTADSALRRCGQLADGWLPSFCTPDDVARGIPIINEHAEAVGRQIEDEHFGVLFPYADGEVPEMFAALAAKRRPGVDPNDMIAADLDAATELIERYVEAGASKFVVVPVVEPDGWDTEIARVADVLKPLQT